MWLVISYDIPSLDSAIYRKIRKIMLKAGFSFPQKSLGWKWIPSAERAETICRTVKAAVPSSGSILLWQISDRIFSAALQWKDGTPNEMPAPPDPWMII